MKPLAVLAILAIAAPALADRKTEEVALIAASAADIITTEMALARDPWTVDGVEYVPTEGGAILSQFKSPAARVAVKAAGTAGIIWLARYFEGKGHPRAASIIRISSVSLWNSAAGWNLSLTIRR